MLPHPLGPHAQVDRNALRGGADCRGEVLRRRLAAGPSPHHSVPDRGQGVRIRHQYHGGARALAIEQAAEAG
eukprot:11943983-Alexandrium_andersonii.AAC.1